MSVISFHDAIQQMEDRRVLLKISSEVDLKLTDLVHSMGAGFYHIRRDLDLPYKHDPNGPLVQMLERLDPIQANFNLIRLERGML